MRLLLDEMLSPLVAQALRDRGHDVEALVASPSYRALSDDEVMVLVREQRRALVTDNIADFRPRHYEAIVPGGPGHFGTVFLPSGYRRSRADIGRARRGARGEARGISGRQGPRRWRDLALALSPALGSALRPLRHRDPPRLAAREERLGIDVVEPPEEVPIGVVVGRSEDRAARVPRR